MSTCVRHSGYQAWYLNCRAEAEIVLRPKTFGAFRMIGSRSKDARSGGVGGLTRPCQRLVSTRAAERKPQTQRERPIAMIEAGSGFFGHRSSMCCALDGAFHSLRLNAGETTPGGVMFSYVMVQLNAKPNRNQSESTSSTERRRAFWARVWARDQSPLLPASSD